MKHNNAKKSTKKQCRLLEKYRLKLNISGGIRSPCPNATMKMTVTSPHKRRVRAKIEKR